MSNQSFQEILSHIIQPDGIIDWTMLDTQFPFLQELELVSQNPLYHEEGNVGVHTRMVIEALVQLSEWRKLPPQEQKILFLSAIFHDLGKTVCTKIDEITGEIISPKHAKVGALMTRIYIWKNISIPFEVREQIVSLVRYHGLPLWFFERPNPEKEIYLASQHVPLHWIALLAEADVRGRTCQDQQELLDRVELFRQFSQEHNCYKKAKAFPNERTKYSYFQGNLQDPTYPVYNQTNCEVIMLSGLPGVGKDFWIHQNNPGLPVISLDDLRTQHKISPKENQGTIIQLAKEHARKYLRAKQSFIWNATNLTMQLRAPLIKLFQEYGARVTIIYLEKPYDVLIKQNNQREQNVPLDAIERMIRKLEIPSSIEAHEVKWIIS